MTSPIQNVAIIGAGLSGLIASRRFLEAGFNITVFERRSDVGGLWLTAYPSIRLQHTQRHYVLFDYPAPDYWTEKHPSKEDILRYFRGYANHFKLRPHIRFNTSVTGLVQPENSSWIVKSSPVGSDEQVQEEFDFVVVCQGFYTHQPNVPAYPGQGQFAGQLLHASQLQDESVMDNKKVVVVGYGKTALDMACEASRRGATAHLVSRNSRWTVPYSILGIPFEYYYFIRLTQLFTPSWVHLTKFERWCHSSGIWLTNAVWSIVAALVKFTHGWGGKDDSLRPATNLTADLSASSAFAPKELYKLIRSGRIKAHIPTTIERLSSNSVCLSSGEEIECDFLLLCTGTQNDYSIFPKSVQDLVESDGLYLYRRIVHPDVPRLGFINCYSYINPVSAELMAIWLTASVRGELVLPSKEEQLADIELVRAYNRTIRPASISANVVGPNFMQFHDQLCSDLGVSLYRKLHSWPGGSWNPLAHIAEYLGVYDSQDYQGIEREVFEK